MNYLNATRVRKENKITIFINNWFIKVNCLSNIETQKFKHFITVNCPAMKRADCTAWTGLNDIDIEGTYVWEHSKAPLTFSNWHPKEPSVDNPNRALTRDCIDILREGIWNDRQCSHLNWVICEKSFWQWYSNSSDFLT